MGLISSAIDSALESIGTSMMDSGEWMLQGGYDMWKSCSSITMSYIKQDPMTQVNAWQIVTGNIYTVSLAVAASLAVLFFVMGWLKESIDIRNSFTLENMVRFFIRYAITASLIVNSLALVTAITQCATAIVATVGSPEESTAVTDVFGGLKESMEEDTETDGGTWFAVGAVCMIGGMIGGLTIIVCSIKLVLSVLSRLFKLMLCVPFAPVAFSGFAGGYEFSQSGIAWLKSFTGYCLEAVVIALAIAISFGLFQDASMFQASEGSAAVVNAIMQICEYCMPMITACACVAAAEVTIRKCLGLG